MIKVMKSVITLMMFIILAFTFVLVNAVQKAMAHEGSIDRQGCHTVSETKEVHCHVITIMGDKVEIVKTAAVRVVDRYIHRKDCPDCPDASDHARERMLVNRELAMLRNRLIQANRKIYTLQETVKYYQNMFNKAQERFLAERQKVANLVEDKQICTEEHQRLADDIAQARWSANLQYAHELVECLSHD